MACVHPIKKSPEVHFQVPPALLDVRVGLEQHVHWGQLGQVSQLQRYQSLIQGSKVIKPLLQVLLVAEIESFAQDHLIVVCVVFSHAGGDAHEEGAGHGLIQLGARSLNHFY